MQHYNTNQNIQLTKFNLIYNKQETLVGTYDSFSLLLIKFFSVHSNPFGADKNWSSDEEHTYAAIQSSLSSHTLSKPVHRVAIHYTRDMDMSCHDYGSRTNR